MSLRHNHAVEAGTPSARKPFIVREISADMLRKHPQLSKGARMLWLTMKGMADHRTGELRHRGHWFTGAEIDKRAEISTRRRKDLMKELAVAGLVRWERERVTRYVTDRSTRHQRMRCVLGHTRYFVVKDPHKQRGSSKVQSLHDARNAPTSLSELHPERVPASRIGQSVITAPGAAQIDQAKLQGEVPRQAVENPERQFNQQLETAARESSLPQNWWPRDQLRADLFGGLHSGFKGKTGMHVIAKAFCDSQRLTFKEQLRECVSVAVTTLSLARTGKLMVLDANDIEKRAVSKLESAGETLHTFELVKDFASRSRLVTQYVARIVVESAAELLEARPVSDCADAVD